MPMVVVREPVTAAATMEDMSSTETATLKRWRGAETATAAAKMDAASTVTAATKMHAAATTMAAAAKMHPASTVATTAAAAAMAAMHLRGQAFRDLTGRTGRARIDQRHRLRGLVGGGRDHEERGGREPKTDQATP
jgi:hypothetical protein